MNRSPGLPASLCSAALLAACAAPPEEPYHGPEVELSSEIAAGTLLARRSNPGDFPGAPFELHVEFLVFRRYVADSLPPLSGETGLIVPALGDIPLGAVARHLGGTRLGHGAMGEETRSALAAGEFGPVRVLGECHEVLSGGLTAEFTATLENELVVLLVEHPKGGALKMALRYSPAPAGLAEDVDAAALRDETLLFRAAGEEGDESLLIVVPAPFEKAPRDSLALAVRWNEGTEVPADPATAQEDPVPAPVPAPLLAVLQARFEAPLRVRKTLLFGAGETGAGIADDLAMAAPEEVLAQAATTVRDALRDVPAGVSRDELRWILDRATLYTLARRAQERELEPELEAVLLRHLGEVGRSPSLVLELLALPGPDFRQSVVQENVSFLQDYSPASRVRAHDWLAMRGQAPEGYDPLADAASRQAALKALEKQEQEEASGGAR